MMELHGNHDLEVAHRNLIFSVPAQLHELGHFRYRAAVSHAPYRVEHLPVEERHRLLYRKFHERNAFRQSFIVCLRCETSRLDGPFRYSCLFLARLIHLSDLLLLRMLLLLERIPVKHAFLGHDRCCGSIRSIEYMSI